ncbi:unnamed protein product [Prunus armeniaca]|uniref:Uncharacterized protein n=1 Tax=Prunus armeniaca TaxID=36596 RepID=A0A6J5V9U3_PRUAR|nr:unnamed protein product [Prunus armeniaca]CAB4316246.1 unnamed protein product [Prunus armeniaca]
MLKWNKPICPRIFKKVEGNKAKVGACVAMWSGGVINYKGGLNVMDFVDDCYLTTIYFKTCRKKEDGEHKGKMNMRESSNQAETALSPIPNTHYSLKFGQCGKKGHNRRTCHRNLPSKAKPATKRKRGTENTQTIIDPSQAATSVGLSTIKKRSKPLVETQKIQG